MRYLIIGGYAVMKYTEPRWTKDLDLLIAIDSENARSVFAALKEFGAPLTGLTPAEFTDAESFYQMGRPPLRVDVLMSIPGVTFEDAWERRETVAFGDTSAIFISREDLILSKQASGRPQDLMDLENLRKEI